MGGLDTAVTPRERGTSCSRRAWWDPVTIRRTSRRLGLHTDASHRFERGADLEAIPGALDLAASLILEGVRRDARAGPARRAGSAVPRAPRDAAPRPSPRSSRATTRLTLEFAEEALRAARLRLRATRQARLRCRSRSFARTCAARRTCRGGPARRGYDRIPSRLPAGARRGTRFSSRCGRSRNASPTRPPPRDSSRRSAFPSWTRPRRGPTTRGSALSGSAAERLRLRLANPLDEGRRHLRATLLPGVLDAVSATRAAAAPTPRSSRSAGPSAARGAPEDPESFESRRLAFALCGEVRPHWSAPPATRPADFFDAKGIAERLLEQCVDPATLSWSPFEADALRARGRGSGARGVRDAWSRSSGAIADGGTREAPPAGRRLRGRARARRPPAATGGEVRFSPSPRFPPSHADLSFAPPRSLTWSEIDAVRARAESRRPRSRCGSSTGTRARAPPEGRVKTTMRLTFRSAERTLEQDGRQRRSRAARRGLEAGTAESSSDGVWPGALSEDDMDNAKIFDTSRRSSRSCSTGCARSSRTTRSSRRSSPPRGGRRRMPADSRGAAERLEKRAGVRAGAPAEADRVARGGGIGEKLEAPRDGGRLTPREASD